MLFRLKLIPFQLQDTNRIFSPALSVGPWWCWLLGWKGTLQWRLPACGWGTTLSQFRLDSGSSCWTCFWGCHLSRAQVMCTRGACDGLFAWATFQHPFIAAHHSSAAFTSLCVTNYLIILSFFSLVNRFQVYNGFDACIRPCGCSKPMLHLFGGLLGRAGEYAACSPDSWSSASEHQTCLSFSIFILYFYISYIFLHSKSHLTVSPGVSPIPFLCGGKVQDFCWVPWLM